MKHISLFTGIGGIDLAAEWAGFETVLMVENNAYCQKVLKKHWPDVPILEDIFNVNRETIKEALAHSQQFRCFGQSAEGERRNRGESSRSETIQSGNKTKHQDRDSLPPITLLTGGFPCQPFSVAGKQRGKEDDRYLWPEMLRVIKEVRPRYIVAENVAGLIRLGLDDCLSDLEREGYITETFLIPACAVNAPHRRDRIFIVAHTNDSGSRASRSRDNNSGQKGNEGWGKQSQPEFGRQSEDVADTNGQRPQGHGGLGECGGEWLTWQGGSPLEGIWESEPPVGRVASGVSKRVDRLKALGNAVVPQQIYPILKAIADIEQGRVCNGAY